MMKSLSVVLGALVAAGSIGAASGQEAERDPAELFRTLDANRDGKLVASEIAGERLQYFERLLRVGDDNGDGALSRAEFESALRPELTPRAAELPAEGPGAGLREILRRRFEELDRDRDGRLTLEELPAEMRPRAERLFELLGRKEISRNQLDRFPSPENLDPRRLFDRADRNGDGKITLDEFPPELRDRLPAPLKERLGAREITREEFFRIVEQLRRMRDARPEMRPGEATPPGLFRLLDANRDGRLSRDELSKAAEHFEDLDRNRDGQLDPRELIGGPLGIIREAPERTTNRPDFGGIRGPLFNRFDRNRDGRLTKDELPERIRSRLDRAESDREPQRP